MTIPRPARVMLVNPPGPWPGSVAIGLAYLAATLKRAGEEARVIDLNHRILSAPEFNRELASFRPDLVGVSIKSAVYRQAEECVNRIRATLPGVPLVIGGPHVTLDPAGALLELPAADYAIAGEAEEALPQLVRFLRAEAPAESVAGLCRRSAERLVIAPPARIDDLDALPFPDFEAFAGLDRSSLVHPILTSRGCPYGCTFCSVPGISGRKWRAASARRVIEEMKHFIADGVRIFDIWDDNFTLDRARALEICRRIADERLGIVFQCLNGLRADSVDEALAAALAAAGCRSVYFGVESADPEIFATLSKGETLADIERATRLLQRVGIPVGAHFIIGLPGDRLAKMPALVRFARRLGFDHVFLNQLVPYPGTRIFTEIAQRGILLRDFRDGLHSMGADHDAVRMTYEMPGFPEREMKEAHRLGALAFGAAGSGTGRRTRRLFEMLARRWRDRAKKTPTASLFECELTPTAVGGGGEAGFFLPLGAAIRVEIRGPQGCRGRLLLDYAEVGRSTPDRATAAWNCLFEIGKEGIVHYALPRAGGPDRGFSAIRVEAVADTVPPCVLRVALVG